MGFISDQFGRLLEKAKLRPGKEEKNPLPVAPIMDSNREYVTDGLTPERLATVFKEADQGEVRRQAELFDLLEERDGHLLCERDKRRNVILDGDFDLTPASSSARDGQVCDFIQDLFDNMADWDDTLVSMQDAVGKGYSSLEIHWDVSNGQAVPERFEFLEQKRFYFVTPEGLLTRVPRLLTDKTPMGEDIPPWKTIFHVYGGKSGHPTRSAIFRVCTWMMLFKHYSIKDWLTFGELFGMPLRIGRYDSNASDDDKNALYAAVSSLGSDAAGVISKSTEIDFIENAKSGTVDIWKALANLCNAEMSKAILGQTLTTEVGDKGSYAASKTHDGVRVALMRADGRAIASTIRQQLIQPLVGFNFGWDTELPEFKFRFGEAEDLEKKEKWVGGLMDRGVGMPVTWLRKSFDIPEPQDGEEVIFAPTAKPDNQSDTSTEHTAAKLLATIMAKSQTGDIEETSARRTLEALGKSFANEVDIAALVDPAEQLLDQVNSLDEYRDRLQELFADLDVTELGEMMARSLAAADLSGRFDVNAENGPESND